MQNKTVFKDMTFTGERAEFMAKDTAYINCTFADGESPLKHSQHITCDGCSFKWKYPLWYSRDIEVTGGKVYEMGRAGIWYSENVHFKDVDIVAPKSFRRCRGLSLTNTVMPFAEETMWHCEDVTLKNVTAKGDYLAMNCTGMKIDSLTLDGNYPFDGARDILITNSVLNSKDAFWNSENITVIDSVITGEYLGWNSKNLTFINCKIESLQGLCFVDGLTIKGCTFKDTTLAFEYSTLDAEINGAIDSVKNPSAGIIKAGSIGELIMQPEMIDTTCTTIITGENP